MLAKHVEAGSGGEKYAIFEIGKASDIGTRRRIEPTAVAHDGKLEAVIDEDDGGGQQTVAPAGDCIEDDAGKEKHVAPPRQHRERCPGHRQKQRK